MKAFIGLSGGMDSTILLAQLVADGYDVYAYFFNYGSKHSGKEFLSAKAVANHYNIALNLVDMSGILGGSSSGLVSPKIDVPEGHYESEAMKANVVPGRNTLFIATLLSKAQEAVEEGYFSVAISVTEQYTTIAEGNT